MSRFCKAITKTVLREFGRFPNCEMGDPIELGQVGTYHGWPRPRFNLTRTLSDFGIDYQTKPQSEFEGMVNERFTIGENSSVSFSAGHGGYDAANLAFGNSQSLIAQATSMVTKRIDIPLLEQAIKDAIRKGVNWSEDYLVVTHVFVADHYSQFFANSKNAEASLCTNRNSGGAPFHLADPSLNIGVSHTKGSVHCAVARENVRPFFLAQKMKGWRREFRVKSDWSEDDLYLEAYGGGFFE